MKENFVSYVGKSFWGTSVLSEVDDINIEKCAELCGQDPNCTGATFNPDKKACWMVGGEGPVQDGLWNDYAILANGSSDLTLPYYSYTNSGPGSYWTTTRQDIFDTNTLNECLSQAGNRYNYQNESAVTWVPQDHNDPNGAGTCYVQFDPDYTEFYSGDTQNYAFLVNGGSSYTAPNFTLQAPPPPPPTEPTIEPTTEPTTESTIEPTTEPIIDTTPQPDTNTYETIQPSEPTTSETYPDTSSTDMTTTDTIPTTIPPPDSSTTTTSSTYNFTRPYKFADVDSAYKGTYSVNKINPNSYGNTTLQLQQSPTQTYPTVYNNQPNTISQLGTQTTLQMPVQFYGPNGTTAKIITTSSETIIVVIESDGTTTVYTYNKPVNNNNITTITFTGINGGYAKIIIKNNNYVIVVVNKQGGTIYFYTSNVYASSNTSKISFVQPPYSSPIPSTNVNYDNYNHYLGIDLPVIFYGPNNQTLKVITGTTNTVIIVTKSDGSIIVYTYNQPVTTNTITTVTFYGNNGGYAKVIKKNNNYIVVVVDNSGIEQLFYVNNVYENKSFQVIQNNEEENSDEEDNVCPSNNDSYKTSSSTSTYNAKINTALNNSDKYILKSEIVPPVCPRCPSCMALLQYENGQSSNSSGNSSGNKSGNKKNKYSNKYTDISKCPPCPACARCPEPAFECKKVPNYNSVSGDYMLPVPVLNDFSTFGM